VAWAQKCCKIEKDHRSKSRKIEHKTKGHKNEANNLGKKKQAQTHVQTIGGWRAPTLLAPIPKKKRRRCAVDVGVDPEFKTEK